MSGNYFSTIEKRKKTALTNISIGQVWCGFSQKNVVHGETTFVIRPEFIMYHKLQQSEMPSGNVMQELLGPFGQPRC